MAEVVKMPKMSDTMTEGVLAKWHKKVGDKIKSGDLLAEVETDKATMDFESYQDGTILYIGAEVLLHHKPNQNRNNPKEKKNLLPHLLQKWILPAFRLPLSGCRC